MEVYAAARTYETPKVTLVDEQPCTEDGLPLVNVSSALSNALNATAGDRLLISDHRWWFGGLRSTQVEIAQIQNAESGSDIQLTQAVSQRVRASRVANVVVERLL